MKLLKSTWAFTLIELLVVISIIAILAGAALPVFSSVQERGAQTKNLSNAKQIGLACKMYAMDNDGKFVGSGSNSATSNAAFQELIPNYVPDESLFYLAKSLWSPNKPNGNKTIDAGENNFAVITNLTDSSNPSLPLLADAPKDTGGAYSAVETDKGGVWKGKKAVLIRCDTSAKIEILKDLQIKTNLDGSEQNALSYKGDNWLSTSQTLVLPN